MRKTTHPFKRNFTEWLKLITTRQLAIAAFTISSVIFLKWVLLPPSTKRIIPELVALPAEGVSEPVEPLPIDSTELMLLDKIGATVHSSGRCQPGSAQILPEYTPMTGVPESQKEGTLGDSNLKSDHYLVCWWDPDNSDSLFPLVLGHAEDLGEGSDTFIFKTDLISAPQTILADILAGPPDPILPLPKGLPPLDYSYLRQSADELNIPNNLLIVLVRRPSL